MDAAPVRDDSRADEEDAKMDRKTFLSVGECMIEMASLEARISDSALPAIR